MLKELTSFLKKKLQHEEKVMILYFCGEKLYKQVPSKNHTVTAKNDK